jgi:uncharacterized SAM-binding protein YcdF (DUF218 family)
MNIPAIVVPGSSHRSTRVRLVREAERVTRRLGAEVVVLSGQGEAAEMRSLWQGPDVELVVEEAATSTVENAALTLPLLLERGIRDAVVVLAPAHLPRAGWIFRRVYGAQRIGVKVRAARVLPTPGAVVYELAAACVARRQVASRR